MFLMIKNYRLEEFESIGEWWVPEAPEKRLAGNITFSYEEGLELDILGSFQKDPNDFSSIPIVYGVDKSANFYTLVDCRIWNWSFNFAIINISLRPKFLFKGTMKISTDKVNLIKEIETNYRDFYDFLDTKNFIKFNYSKETKTVTIDSNESKEIQSILHDGTEVLFKPYTDYQRSNKERTFELKYGIRNYISFKDELSYEDVFSFVMKLEDFLSFFFQKVSFSEYYKVKLLINKEKISFDFIHNVQHRYNRKGIKPHVIDNMIHSISDTVEDVDFFLTNWFIKYSSINSCLSRYFHLMYGFCNDIVDFFLITCRMIETLEKIIYSKKNSKLFHSIITLLGYINDSCVIDHKIEDIKKYSKTVVKYRNYFTHPDKAPYENYELILKVKTIMNTNYNILTNAIYKYMFGNINKLRK